MLRLEASTRREFHAAVSDASAAIAAAGGWVVSHQFFSNRLAVIACQLPTTALVSLVQVLTRAEIKLHQAVPELSHQPDEIVVQLSITVVHDGPDLRRTVPAFG